LILVPLMLAAAMGTGIVTVGLLTGIWQIENQAAIVTIGLEAYWDVTATMKCDRINWGVLYPGQSKITTVYIKNTATAPFTASMLTWNWDPPAAANYISVQWDFGSGLLLPGRIRETHFNLTVAQTITGITSFAFVINVTATG